jgi:toxin ParE1/3/4
LKRRYIITGPADRDTIAHFSYIDQHNHAAAVRFLQAAEAAYEKLAAMPELGERQHFRREGLAKLRAWQVRGFENYVVYYRPIEEGIEVVRVLHAARDAATILEEDRMP